MRGADGAWVVVDPDDYVYQAPCLKTGATWQLPCTEDAKAQAKLLMQSLAVAEPPPPEAVYGVLIAQNDAGERVVLKGVSGELTGRSPLVGWVPPLGVSARMAILETKTLAKLEALKQALVALNELPVRVTYDQVAQQYATDLALLKAKHKKRKAARDRARAQCKQQQLSPQGHVQKAHSQEDRLQQESQQDGLERRRLKQNRADALAPLAQKIEQAEQQMTRLKQAYGDLSKRWQAAMQAAYLAERRAADGGRDGGRDGRSLPWEHAVLEALGEDHDGNIAQRAGAKLLHAAMLQQLMPVAMAEFWWGPQAGDRAGKFLGAVAEDCQVLMQICGLKALSWQAEPLPTLSILYQDESLIVVDKPAGLLSVPGRSYALQDSVMNRLRYSLPARAFLQPVHRLDQATSGLMVVATSSQSLAALQQQFAQRQVRKTYEAILSRPVEQATGTVALPLWGDPARRPLQTVDFQRGKPSVTDYRVLSGGERPRVEFGLRTGRTHQLRVHAAHPQGLGAPILGDALYGEAGGGKERLHLHAASLELVHPTTNELLRFRSDVPF